MMGKLLIFLIAAKLLALCACSDTDAFVQTDDADIVQADVAGANATEVQYDYQLKAGETTEVIM